jgi:hypothetical protein
VPLSADSPPAATQHCLQLWYHVVFWEKIVSGWDDPFRSSTPSYIYSWTRYMLTSTVEYSRIW